MGLPRDRALGRPGARYCDLYQGGARSLEANARISCPSRSLSPPALFIRRSAASNQPATSAGADSQTYVTNWTLSSLTTFCYGGVHGVRCEDTRTGSRPGFAVWPVMNSTRRLSVSSNGPHLLYCLRLLFRLGLCFPFCFMDGWHAYEVS